jgi:hypothetical protein
VTKYPPPYPRKDFSFDDKVPERPDTTKHYPDVTISVDNPNFAYRGRQLKGQRQLALIRAYFDQKKKVRLGGSTLVNTKPATDDREKGAFQQNKDRSPAQKTLHPDSQPVLYECMKDLFEIVLQQQTARRQSARLPMVSESFPDRNATVDQRLEAARQYRAIINDMAKEQIDSRANAVVRAIKDQAAARALLRDVMTVQDSIRYQRQRNTESDHRRMEQSYEDRHRKRLGAKYEPKHRKRYLGEIVDLQNLPPVFREDFAGAAGSLLGIAGSSVAHAYGLNLSPLQSVYRAFRRKRTKARMTTPKQPKPQPPLPHEREYQEFVRRNAERRRQRELRAAQGTMT